MPLFPIIETENIIQVNDKLRISCTKTFASKGEDAITTVEVEPHTDVGFVDITGSTYSDWYLDWVYFTDEEKVITLRVSNDTITETVTKTVTCVSEADDKLFSNDNDLVLHEFDILRWLPEGKSSYNYMHRNAQSRILAYLDEKGYVDVYGEKFTKASVIDTSEFAQWSKFMVLRLIFESLSNATDDIFHAKAMRYEALEIEARNRAVIRLDLDKSGTLDGYENLNLSGIVLRR